MADKNVPLFSTGAGDATPELSAAACCEANSAAGGAAMLAVGLTTQPAEAGT